MAWQIARGKLGPLAPLLGSWVAHTDSPRGPVVCRRTFSKELNGSHIVLRAAWEMGQTTYEEAAYYGVDRQGTLRFWSFTSDGKQSHGEQTDTTDVHPQAIGFVAEMPAGVARMVFWPDDADGFFWAVESKTKKGWNRFTEHHYAPAGQSDTLEAVSSRDRREIAK